MERVIFGATFEALFIRGLGSRLDAGSRADLRALGLDLDKPLHTAYSGEVWRTTTDWAAASLFPELSMAEAQFRLGQRTVEGLEETLLGKAVAAVARLIGPRRTLLRVPRNAKNNTNYGGIEALQRSPTEIEIINRQYDNHPEFMRGAMVATLAVCSAREGKVETIRYDPKEELLVLLASWVEGQQSKSVSPEK